MGKAKNKLKLIGAPVYGYWEAFYMSFYSSRLYVDVGKRWRGMGVLYLLFSIALMSIPFALRIGFILSHSLNEQIIEPLSQLPSVYVQNGEASFDKPMPYFIKNNKNQVVLIVDTTGKVNEFSAEYPYLNMLINKDKMYFRIPIPVIFSAAIPEPDLSPSFKMFDQGSNFVLNGKKIIDENHMVGFKNLLPWLIYPLVVSGFYSVFLVIFLVLAFLGQVFSSIFFHFKVSFMESCRLFIVATTPMLLVLMTILSMDIVFPGFGIILLAILVVYFSLAVYSLRRESTQMVLR